MYELSGAPFRPDPKAPTTRVVDRAGEVVTLMGDSREILRELAEEEAWKDAEVAYVSRTEYPEWADACLKVRREKRRSGYRITDGTRTRAERGGRGAGRERGEEGDGGADGARVREEAGGMQRGARD